MAFTTVSEGFAGHAMAGNRSARRSFFFQNEVPPEVMSRGTPNGLRGTPAWILGSGALATWADEIEFMKFEGRLNYNHYYLHCQPWSAPPQHMTCPRTYSARQPCPSIFL